jgi:hypothetical protein
MVNQMNPGGFINAAGGVVVLGLTVPAGIGTAAAVTDAGTIMLGQATAVNAAGQVASGYVEIGGVVGADTLNMPTAVWTAMTQAQQESTMMSFIDTALQNGSQVVFTANPALAPAGTGTAFEYGYITQLGYQIVQSGTSWVVVP